MYRVMVNGVEVTCDSTNEIRNLLGFKKQKSTARYCGQKLAYDISLADWGKVNKEAAKEFGSLAKRMYSDEERRSIARVTKASEFIPLAKEMQRTPRALVSAWYDVKKRGVR